MAARPRNFLVKIVTFTLFGLLIASFAVWGIGDIFRGGGQIQSVAEVGDTQILRQDFARTLSREVNRLSARFGGQIEMEQARALGIVDQVLGQMIGRTLFDLKADELGLVVTDEQVRRRITQEPAFRNQAGQFDRGLFVQTLQISGLGEQEYVETLRRDIQRQQLAGAVSEGAAAPRQMAEALYRYREERRVAQFITVPNDSITDLPEPDETALKAFHKEFADNFMAPESRAVSLVQLRAKELAEEISVSESELAEEFESRKEDFVTPERRGVEQILLDSDAAAQNAGTRLDGGADFAAVAQELTGGPPVDLGEVERDSLPEELAEAIFTLGSGQVSAPVKSELGWHLLRVTKIAPRKEATLAEVREELAKDIAMRGAVETMISFANQLDDELAGGASLEEAAGGLNLALRRIEAITREGKTPFGGPVEDLPGERFIQVAFETETGQESLLTETGEGDYFVLRVDGVTRAQVRPLSKVREEVVELWRNAQRAERAREKAEYLAERAKVGVDLAILATENGYSVTTTEPLTRFETAASRTPSPVLPSRLFQIKQGEITTVTAANAHIVAKLIEIRPADPAKDAEQVAELRKNLASSLKGDMLEQFVITLRQEFGVRVNEQQLDTLLASF
ncbi:MAG: SurA N-terminal domain-containing protein [Kiloniellales bacterium]